MAQKKKSKIKYIDINVKKSSFVSKLTGGNKSHIFSDVKLLRKLLSDEKAKIIDALKTNEPSSIYELAKVLKRDFKSVREDAKLLEKFGVIEFKVKKTGKRKSLCPSICTEKLQITMNL